MQIDIDKNLIPYEFEIVLNNKLYTLGIDYNTSGDFFTATLSYQNEVLVQGEKILLGQVLFRQLYEDKNYNLDPKYPTDIIMPQSYNGKVDRIGYDQLQENCFLYVVERSEVIE